MLPMRFFRNRTFALANVASLLMFFGMFGSIFLLAQFFQTVQGYSPLQAGLRILPWTAMPIFIAPIAGALSDRIGGPPADGRRARAAGDRPGLDRGGDRRRRALRASSSAPFILSGIGMALFFAPVANVVLCVGAARARRVRRPVPTTRSASSAASSASPSWPRSSRATAATEPARLRRRATPAVWVGAAVVGVGALAALTIPVRRKARKAEVVQLEPALEEAA